MLAKQQFGNLFCLYTHTYKCASTINCTCLSFCSLFVHLTLLQVEHNLKLNIFFSIYIHSHDSTVKLWLKERHQKDFYNNNNWVGSFYHVFFFLNETKILLLQDFLLNSWHDKPYMVNINGEEIISVSWLHPGGMVSYQCLFIYNCVCHGTCWGIIL